MIDPNKEYRLSGAGLAQPVINEVHDGFAYGRLGCSPMSWDAITHRVVRGASGFDPKDLTLIEARPEVTVRRYVLKDGSCVFTSPTGDRSMFAPADRLQLGAIDITHDGEKLLKVEIVP